MEYVRLEVVRPQDEVADDTAIVGDLVGDAEGAVQVQGRSGAMDSRTDATDALSDALGVAGVSPSEDQLPATEQRT